MPLDEFGEPNRRIAVERDLQKMKTLKRRQLDAEMTEAVKQCRPVYLPLQGQTRPPVPPLNTKFYPPGARGSTFMFPRLPPLPERMQMTAPFLHCDRGHRRWPTDINRFSSSRFMNYKLGGS